MISTGKADSLKIIKSGVATLTADLLGEL